MSNETVVPAGVKTASAWIWNLVIIGVGVLILGFLLQKFILITLPLFVALLMASLGVPVVNWLTAHKVPKWFASLGVLLGGIGALALLGYFIVHQVISNSAELGKQMAKGLAELEDWLLKGPFQLDEKQISDGIASAQDFILSKSEVLAASAGTAFGTVSNVLAGALIALFAFYFFLKDGGLIWQWIVNLFPKSARGKTFGSGVVAWEALTKYTQATVLVALVDSIGIMLVAAFLDIPLVLAIGVLVFLGAFIPMVGGLVTGLIPVLLGLVVGGPSTALFMLIGVIAVQQIEGNVLQPFLMGKFVSIHPLGILLAITAGFTVAGIPGALVAVPLAACVNAVCLHLSGGLTVGEEELSSLAVEPEELSEMMEENLEVEDITADEPK